MLIREGSTAFDAIRVRISGLLCSPSPPPHPHPGKFNAPSPPPATPLIRSRDTGSSRCCPPQYEVRIPRASLMIIITREGKAGRGTEGGGLFDGELPPKGLYLGSCSSCPCGDIGLNLLLGGEFDVILI
ncbi:hypothetical protein GWI33_000456 [Rhynchophorus ferrugineus]|uniref:Uncharacterized protein n=1 Tax=Rhynchophorus ferrugineus TaxID=354439 RepID=A0A834LXV5_RHYFE|nr:hypothetical protein GWI33_000456 [Rhynchophorus ferrugineus]